MTSTLSGYSEVFFLFLLFYALVEGITLKYFSGEANHLQGKCPDGFYSTTKADNSSISCLECKKCAEVAYELSPCTGDKDRVCFPDPVFYVTTRTETNGEEDDDKEGVVIETSANVFHENLLNTRNLETTQYITDVTQATDFNWERDSGLMVNIGIYNVHLLPSYKDFDHEENSDNKFMSQNPDLLANQSFQAVRKSFCRYPVPDYYNLNLDVTANRTTRTERIQCSPENDFCRSGEHQRTLNFPCSDSQSHLVHQQQHPNSVVCVAETQLLSHVFKLRSGPDLPFGQFAKKCLLAHKKCNFCLESPRCKAALGRTSAPPHGSHLMMYNGGCNFMLHKPR